jgi:hypothetical protein
MPLAAVIAKEGDLLLDAGEGQPAARDGTRERLPIRRGEEGKEPLPIERSVLGSTRRIRATRPDGDGTRAFSTDRAQERQTVLGRRADRGRHKPPVRLLRQEVSEEGPGLRIGERLRALG